MGTAHGNGDTADTGRTKDTGLAGGITRTFGRAAARASHWARASPLAVDLLIAAGLGIVAFPWTAWLLLTEGTEADVPGVLPTDGGWLGLVLGAAVIGHVALAGRRVRPLTSCLLVLPAVLVQVLATPWLVLPSMLVVLPSLYSVAAYGPDAPPDRSSRVPLGPAVGLAAAVVGSLLVSIVAYNAGPAPPRLGAFDWGLLRVLPALLLACGLGLLRRVRLAYAARLAELERAQRVREAVTEQRNQIAREMHDVIAHALSVVISQANGGRYAVRGDPERAVQILTTIARTGQQALADTRGMLHMLRPPATESPDADPDPDTAPPVVPPSLDDLPDLVERFGTTGLSVRLIEDGTRRDVGPATELAAYRLVQEALTNTLQHAGPASAGTVRLAWNEDGLTVTVTDDGPGPPEPGTHGERSTGNPGTGNPGTTRDFGTTGGQGLIGMRERVTAVSGSLTVGPAPGGGFRVQAWFPDPGRGES